MFELRHVPLVLVIEVVLRPETVRTHVMVLITASAFEMGCFYDILVALSTSKNLYFYRFFCLRSLIYSCSVLLWLKMTSLFFASHASRATYCAFWDYPVVIFFYV